ncbi:carbohydrate-binding module family 1 protein [Hypomontagnella monticulosa]|nr:carbohydrate-binding module family 1 protein [Hypomontagnella monticulosa]
MGIMRISLVVAALVSAATVAAHGHVDHIVVNGVSFQGYDPTNFPYQQNPPTVVGWATSQLDNGFVEPNSFGNADIICHKTSANAGGHVQVKAGDSISITWNTWPESHKGPMIDYLAPCNGDCETVDKESLEFFKIDEVGLIDDSAQNGFWGSDVLIQNNNTWLVQIPANIKAGNYVLRHETIALHSAGQVNGAQAYPQCFNLEVTGDGTDVPAGTLGTKLYNAEDPGIVVNIYTTGLSYTIPGPALIAVGNGGTAPTNSPAGSTTVAQTSAAETAAPAPTSQPQSNTVVVPTPTTLATSTRAASPTSAPAVVTSAPATPTGAVNAQSLYGQCGGSNFAGPTACAEGACKSWNPYYFQCVASA